MKVKELIKELKKQPQEAEVGVSHHDNAENEVAGQVHGVTFTKDPIFAEKTEHGWVILES